MASPADIDLAENRRRMQRGDLYYAFTPDLLEDRRLCTIAVNNFNKASRASRRELVELWAEIARDDTALPPTAATTPEDDALLEDYPWIEAPLRMDYGYNVRLGANVYINANSTWIDTCTISIGARTLIGPNCSFYSGTHPTDPVVRNGTRGPELGKPITIGEDCWIGGNVIVLAGVTIGAGTTVGAGSVVVKSLPSRVVAVGNPARVVNTIV